MARTIKELYDLSGKVAFVTGGTRGLGLQMAEGLAEAGADLALVSIHPAAHAQQAKQQLEHAGRRVLVVQADVTDREQVAAAVEKTVRDLGRLDICIANAGINDVHPIAPEGLEKWTKILAVNATGVYLTCAAAAGPMRSRGAGSIITISSIYGLVGLDKLLYVDDPDADFQFPAYHASKGAVVNLTRDLATNLGPAGIRANCICPATFVSDQNRDILQGEVLSRIERRTPLGRTGEDDDLKGVALFLASDASKYVTGQILAVDGGWLAW
jgi:gluconate 5-dehydrogenase